MDVSAGTDIHASRRGLVSVTPLHFDVADREQIVELQKIFKG